MLGCQHTSRPKPAALPLRTWKPFKKGYHSMWRKLQVKARFDDFFSNRQPFWIWRPYWIVTNISSYDFFIKVYHHMKFKQNLFIHSSGNCQNMLNLAFFLRLAAILNMAALSDFHQNLNISSFCKRQSSYEIWTKSAKPLLRKWPKSAKFGIFLRLAAILNMAALSDFHQILNMSSFYKRLPSYEIWTKSAK